MTDDDLIAGFEAYTIPPGAFGHREHVRLAWLYLRRHGRSGAEARLLAGLRAFAAAAGRPDKFDAALTRAWVARIAAATAALPRDHSFEDLLASHPELLDRRVAAELAQPI
jgi:hypothetical protein